MATPTIQPSGREVFFANDELIVSKTDPRGIITYANAVFERVSGYAEDEILGQPHNLIRHPEMPRCVFKLLWDVLGAGDEIFAYVNNLSKNGDNYWVFAHVTPSFDRSGGITSFHSSRRVPDRSALEQVIPLYADLLRIEQQADSKSDGMEQSFAHLLSRLDQAGTTYPEFVFSI